MNTLRNIFVGGVALAIIVFAIWLIVKFVVWLCNVFGKVMGWLVDTMFSPDAMNLYGRILAVATVIFLAWVIGKLIQKK